MYAQIKKPKENKNQSVAKAPSQKKNDSESTFQLIDNRPEAVTQRKLQATGNNSPKIKQAVQLQAMADNHSAQKQPIQCKPHKPQVNSKVMYNEGGAADPANGERCTVLASADDGSLTIRRDRDNHTYPAKNWKTDPIWLEYAADAKDTDWRQTDAAWTALTKSEKATIYSQAKTQALTHIKASVTHGMLNVTNRNNLNTNLSLGFFSKIKKGEWQATWTEPNSNGRKWLFTIDMDDPLETSWQAAHVGWEVKLLDKGANNADPPVAYAAFAKQQGHIWLNDVPEARGLG